jgi:hypothetical protein
MAKMAVLTSLNGNAEFKFELLSAAPLEAGNEFASWVPTRVEVKEDGKCVLFAKACLTKTGIHTLHERLLAVAAGNLESFFLAGFDEDILVAAGMIDPVGDCWVGFWVGELPTLMKGYRILVLSENVAQFARDLERDLREREESVEPGAC